MMTPNQLDDVLADIQSEVDMLKQDTNRPITPINELLVDLAKIYGKMRRDFRSYETSYELNHNKAKEDKEQEMIKAKASKITDAELNRYATKNLLNDYKEMQDKRGEMEELEPIVNFYKNYVDGLKYDGRTVISFKDKPF